MVHTLFYAATAKNMSNHGNPSHDDDNHASQHEYNYFLDKEIQKKLLRLDDAEYIKEWNSEFKSITHRTSTNNGTQKTQKSKSKPVKHDEFCGWFENSGSNNSQEASRRLEKISRLSREKEQTIGWKDTRLREISFVFKHYGDISNYIEQYRYEHTYNFGPLGREPIEITTCKIVPLRDTLTPHVYSDKHHQPFPSRHKSSSSHSNPTRYPSPEATHKQEIPNSESLSRLSHAHSESNILDLAYKYKFAPSALKEAKASKTSPTSPRSVSRSESVKLPSRPNSGKTGGQSNGVMRVTPSLVALGPIGHNFNHTTGRSPPVQLLSPSACDGPPKSPTKRITNDSPQFGPAYTKVNYRSPSLANGNGPEKPGLTFEKYSSAPKLVLAPNSKLRTLDLITHMSEPQESDAQNGLCSYSSVFNGPTNTEPCTNGPPSQDFRSPHLKVDGSVVKETASILKEGCDRDNFKSLLSELSYLNINTANEDKNTQAIPLDVTGLTVSFAQKYDIRELGFADDTDVKKSQPSSRSVSRSVSRSSSRSSPKLEVAKQAAMLPTINDADLVNSEQTMGSRGLDVKRTPRIMRVQLERVLNQRRSKQETNDIHQREIQWRISKMQQDLQNSKTSSAVTSTYSKKQQLEKAFRRKLEKHKGKVTFNIPDSQRSSAREYDGEVVVELPYLGDSRFLQPEPVDSPNYSAGPASPGLIVSSPDKISIMRRYFMDVAEREGNAYLSEQLRVAPDKNFKPGSAGDVYDLARQKRTKTDQNRQSPHSPTYKHARHQRLGSKKVTRSKSQYGKSDFLDGNDKSKLTDLDKLTKLKEIYLKQTDNVDENESAGHAEVKYKPSVSVLQKMRQGAEDVEGMWFDSTGRAYVSLATRYDPVRK